LLRPGRFDRQVIVPLPDVRGREKILQVHMRKVPISDDVDASVLGRGTPGFSGADLENLVNEAALLAARRNKRIVTMAEMEGAKDKVMMGPERRSMVMSESEKELTAYHEAGHAIAAIHMEDSDPIHKATIIPRGRALGMVMRLPESDRVSMTRAKLLAELVVAMGGRVAEEMIFGSQKVTTGASSDISHATSIARNMVTQWGMSDKLGPLAYAEPEREVFLGHSVTEHKNISDSTAASIDAEIKRLVEEGYVKTQNILKKYKSELVKLAKALLEYETLSGDEITDLLAGKKLRVEDTKKEKKTAPRPRTSVPSGTEKATKLTKKTTPRSKAPKNNSDNDKKS
ncbi:MAG: cell division protein FtsH, partial [bacterium]|nr:cell division protein FtsH [bacterium]